MSEKLTNSEIPVEKTPEQIAQELEKKAKELEASGNKTESERKLTLAKKVRAIESDTVTGTTEVKLKNLQANLPELEKKDFEDAKKTAGIVVAGAGLTIAVKTISDKIDNSGLGALGFKDVIKDWLKENLTEEPSEDDGPFDKFIHKLKLVFLTPFALAFGLSKEDLKTKTEGVVAEVKDEEGKKAEDLKNDPKTIEAEKIGKDVAYNHMIDHVFNRQNRKEFSGWWSSIGEGIQDGTWKKDEKNAEKELSESAKRILHYDFIKGKTYNELKVYKNKPETMDIPNIKEEKEQQAAKLAINSILNIENETWIENNLKTELPNWKDRPIYETMTSLYKGIGFEKIVRIKKSLEGVDWKNPGDITAKISTLMLTKNGNGNYGGIVGENLESFRSQGLDNEVVTRVLDTDGHRTVKDYRNNVLKGTPYKNPLAQKFLLDLTEEKGFSKKVMGLFNAFGFQKYSENFAQGENLTVRQLLILKALTKGETNPENMSKGMRAEVFMVLFGIIFEKNPISLTGDKIIEFIKSPDNKYVKEVYEFVGTQVDRTSYEGMLIAMGVGEDALKLLNEIREKDPAIFYGTITFISLSFVAAYYFRVPMITASIARTIIIAGAGMAGITYIGSKG
ncbi:MAG: hypothetical protein PHZ26_05570 [Candidatus Gracilibacteria bacterium]|nr:hypothetical protein [Candidatus Gracilibacteria bacterium]MDD2909185.1 hypothetical protein [Candidatus Gracilibacteria bacterium]